MAHNMKAELKSTAEVLSGAAIIVESLKREGVELLFGYPGGAVLPLYDALYDAGIRHVLVRHEQGAIHAAEGYARVSGKPGVVIVTSGPGATNVVTGLADALMDSLPLVVFTGQVASTVIGSDAFQEADVMGVTMPITKHNFQVRNPEDLPRVIKEAFHIATTGRPGPVVVDIPKDMTVQKAIYQEDPDIHLPGYQPNVVPNRLQIGKLLDAIEKSRRPVILAGAGVLFAEASDELRRFAHQYRIPVAHTLLGLGAFPPDDPLFLGMAGMHGTYAANMALYECDLLINIGARFDDRVTGNLKHFAPWATVAHIDIDPAEIGKNVKTHIPIVACARQALRQLLREEGRTPQHENWLQQLQKNKTNYPLWYKPEKDVLKPQQLVEMVYEETAGEAIVTTDVGQHQMWAAQFYSFRYPGRWVTSGGLGTMGFGLPAAIGAQIARPDVPVVALLGDGGFQMTMQELAVIKELELPIKIFLLNNSSLGMVRQWQGMFFEERYSHSLLHVQPDYLKLAEAYGLTGMTAETPEEARRVTKEALAGDGPVLVDYKIAPLENVYPMIAPGKGIHEMVGVRP